MINTVNRLMIGAVGFVLLAGCTREHGVWPSYPDPYKTPQPKLVVDRPGENIEYHNTWLGNPDWVRMNRSNDIRIGDAQKKEECYQTCLDENDARRVRYFTLIAIRKHVRENCKAVGYSGVAMTSEDSPTAHNRIEEDESTGKLVYRERHINVVGVRPHWKCPTGTGPEALEIAEKWMYDMPLGTSQKWCDKIKTVAFTGISLDVCQTWVKED